MQSKQYSLTKIIAKATQVVLHYISRLFWPFIGAIALFGRGTQGKSSYGLSIGESILSKRRSERSY